MVCQTVFPVGHGNTECGDGCNIGAGVLDGNQVFAFSHIQEFHVLLITICPTIGTACCGLHDFCIEAGVGGYFESACIGIGESDIGINNTCSVGRHSYFISNHTSGTHIDILAASIGAGLIRGGGVGNCMNINLNMLFTVCNISSFDFADMAHAVAFQCGKGYLCGRIGGLQFVFTFNQVNVSDFTRIYGCGGAGFVN